MATNAPNCNVTIQKHVDGLIASVKRPDGTYPAAAPNAFVDRLGKQLAAPTGNEFHIEFRVNADGNSAWVRIAPPETSQGVSSIEGFVDLSVLATKLA